MISSAAAHLALILLRRLILLFLKSLLVHELRIFENRDSVRGGMIRTVVHVRLRIIPAELLGGTGSIARDLVDS